MSIINRPIPFNGTEEERRANRLSHFFSGEPGDERCMDCDSRPSHEAANYPCGVSVPRETIEVDNDNPFPVGSYLWHAIEKREGREN